MYEIEGLLKTHLETQFPKEMIFTEENAKELNNEFFKNIDNDSEKVAALILSGGIQVDPPVGSQRTQRFKTLWQVVVVCPKKLVVDVGDAKMEEVVISLRGLRLSKKYDYLKAVSDERGFNRPDYAADLVYLPMMYSTGRVI